MNNSKKLPPGIPVVDDNGTVTSLSVAELALRIGKYLGVYRSEFFLPLSDSDKWYRIACLPKSLSSGIMIINHYWSYGAPAGIMFSFNNCAGGGGRNFWTLNQLSGHPATLPKVRLVMQNPESTSNALVYIDVLLSKSRSAVFSVNCISNSEVVIYNNPEVITDTDDSLVFECDMIQMGGGKRHSISALRECVSERRCAA